jgi:hypothetical protein
MMNALMILIVVIGGESTAISSIPFNSMEACQLNKSAIVEVVGEKVNAGWVRKVSAVCVEIK